MELDGEVNHSSLFLKLCSDHLSIEAIPRKPVKVDMERFKGQSVSGLELMLWTPRFVVLRNRDGHEITLRRDGRMIIRNTPSEEVAEKAANEILRVVSGLS